LITKTFICGCGHSGTTLLANMLAANPRAYVPQFESYMFFKDDPRPFLRRYYLKTLLRGRRHFVEKTPRHVYRIDEIRRCVDGARIVLMVRDGRDVSASFEKRHGELETGNARWLEANEIVLAERDAPDTILLRYEDLVRQPEEWLRRVCEFTGIPFRESMLRFHESQRLWFGGKEMAQASGAQGEDHAKLRNWQVNQPLFDGSGKWKKAFPDGAPAAIVTGRGADLMRAFGYDPDEDPGRPEPE